MSREWERALERQLALIEWIRTPSAELWLHVLRETSPGLALHPIHIEEMLQTADTFYVSDEMMRVVQAAADSEGLGDPVLERHVPFTKSGFAYFQIPIQMWSAVREVSEDGEKSFRPVQLDVQAVCWAHRPIDMATAEERAAGVSVSEEGLSMLLFGSDSQLDTYEEFLVNPTAAADDFRQKVADLMSDLDGLTEHLEQTEAQVAALPVDMAGPELDEILRLKYEQRVLEAKAGDLRSILESDGGPRGFSEGVRSLIEMYGIKQFQAGPMMLIDVHAWGFDVAWSAEHLEVLESDYSGSGSVRDDGARMVAMSVGQTRKFMYALWSLMAQPIAVPRSERPGRAYRRRWEQRVPTSPEYGDIRVVTLRRALHGSGGEGPDDEFGPEWSHRWIVRGHWRKQWYASEGVHRLVWIAPFVKGPDDKPLIIKDQVFEVVR